MGTERILVVEGDKSLRHEISSVLVQAGYPCKEVASESEALAVLKSAGGDLLLAALPAAAADSTSLLAECKNAYPDMPVILLTAEKDVSAALAALRNGAFDYLLKPFAPEQLIAAARRALEHRRLRLENRTYQSSLESLVAARTEQLRAAMADLERSYDITIEIAADLLGLKDAATGVHARRVTAFTVALSRALGLRGDSIRVIARAAILHDIGMIAVPDIILHKPVPLSPQEMETLREHCFRGYQVLKKIPFLREPAEIVYAHEERYDGSGFPRGLKGEEIPLGARIFSVAHALDAILSDRPYRAARTLAEARKEIAQLAGKQFDPDIVRVFLGMPERIWVDLRVEVEKIVLTPAS